MAHIELNDGTISQLAPVLRRQAIGEVARLSLIKAEQRPMMVMKDGQRQPVLKPDGRPRHELVVHGIAMDGTSMEAGLGDQISVPEPGTKVRMILKGKGFSSWIEAKNNIGRALRVGDVVTLHVDHAQAWDNGGKPRGSRITSQAQASKVKGAIGYYGQLTIEDNTDEIYVEYATQAYKSDLELTQNSGASVADNEEPPF